MTQPPTFDPGDRATLHHPHLPGPNPRVPLRLPTGDPANFIGAQEDGTPVGVSDGSEGGPFGGGASPVIEGVSYADGSGQQ